MHPKKSAKASVMASHSKLLLLLATRILRFTLAANLVILSNDVSLNPGPAGPLPQIIPNSLSDESFSLDGRTLPSSYSGLYDTFDSSVELDHCELYPLFDLGLDDKALRIGHWNVNRLTSTKFDQIKLFLSGESGSPQVDVLFLNEIFLKPDIPDSLYAVPGFTIYRCDRISKCGGGVLAFVNQDLRVKRRADLENAHLEITWLEVFPFKSKRSLSISAIYRPPFVLFG